jgi:hypothetical protein
MTTFAIEINDAELVVAGGEGPVTTEPGVAVVEGGKITTGAEAAAQARLKPRLTSNRFWADLSLDAATGIAGAANAAELAFAQLDALWRRVGSDADDVVLIVPSHYRGEQLGLLLGIAEECRMPVRAMIDVAAAASDRPYPGRELVFVDAGLHRISAVPLEQGDDVSALAEQGLENTGLAGLRDALAKRLAELFVLNTRFDPLHRAETARHQAQHGGGNWKMARQKWKGGEWNQLVKERLENAEKKLGRRMTAAEIMEEVEVLMKRRGIPIRFVPYRGD